MSLCFTVHVYDTERPLSFTRGLLATAELWGANHGNTLRGKKTVFTHSAITPPKVNRFG